MNRRRLSRPSLRITRRVDHGPPAGFVVEVWNPFVSAYQAAVSVQDGLRRVVQLSNLICQMWLQRHAKLDALADVPDAVASTGERWAELRISGSDFKSSDTRYDERPVWIRAPGLGQATSVTCTRVGCEPPAATAPV